MLSSVMALHCPDSMSAVADFFNEMTPAKLERLGDIYGPGVEFHDPVHDAVGLSQLRDVLAHRFKEMTSARVKVMDAHGDDRTGFLLWTLTYQHLGAERVIHGTSHFKFAHDGRISAQRDHWDASFVLYGELPVLGWVMRIIKRRAQIIPEKAGT
ncbi:MAG: nuclear transport factor 2 family protein [Verrucomicrobiota bacterium]